MKIIFLSIFCITFLTECHVSRDTEGKEDEEEEGFCSD